MIAQLILIILTFGGWFIAIVKNGEPKGNYSAGYSTISLIIMLILFYYSGIFDFIK